LHKEPNSHCNTIHIEEIKIDLDQSHTVKDNVVDGRPHADEL